MSTYGKAAYEAYAKSFEEHGRDGESGWFGTESYGDLEPIQQTAWQEAAAAVLRLNAEQHCSPRDTRGERATGEGSVFGAGDTV